MEGKKAEKELTWKSLLELILGARSRGVGRAHGKESKPGHGVPWRWSLLWGTGAPSCEDLLRPPLNLHPVSEKGENICQLQLCWSAVTPAELTSPDLQTMVLELRDKLWAEGKSLGEQLTQGVPPAPSWMPGCLMSKRWVRRMGREGPTFLIHTHNKYLSSVSSVPSIVLISGDSHPKTNPSP